MSMKTLLAEKGLPIYTEENIVQFRIPCMIATWSGEWFGDVSACK